jgi:hypothetical protein
MKAGFNLIFWGLLFVALDIRINSIDLFLPDFVGYILIASGLGLLGRHDKWFRRARVMAIVMIFFSLTDLVEVKVDSKQAPRLTREWISLLTGDLSTLLPQQVNSAIFYVPQLQKTQSVQIELTTRREMKTGYWESILTVQLS